MRDHDHDEFLPVWLDENRVIHGEDGRYHVVDLRTFESQDVTEALFGEAESGQGPPAD